MLEDHHMAAYRVCLMADDNGSKLLIIKFYPALNIRKKAYFRKVIGW